MIIPKGRAGVLKTQTRIIDTAIWSWEKARGGDPQARAFTAVMFDGLVYL